jgi:dolichyl-phosphooligosaccharide-protein glycotransferase
MAPETPSKSRGRVKIGGRSIAALAGIAAAALVGLGVRLSAEKELRHGAPARFVSSDCLYHMRRARFAVAHFPRTIIFDPTINYPRGGVAIWPPMFDVLLALPARLLSGPAAKPAEIERLASLVPPVLGALAIFCAGLLGQTLRRGAGPATALFVALCGAHLMYSQYGHTDQHVAESLAGTLALFLFLRARARPGFGRELAAGVALGFAVLVWHGAIFWGALFALALCLDALRRPASEIVRAAAVTLGSGAAVAAGGTLAWLGGEHVPFTYVSFGWFQPAFLLALAEGVVLLDTALRLAARRPLPGFGKRLVLLGAGTAILLPVGAPLLRGLAGGLGYLLRSNPTASSDAASLRFPRELLRQIFETRPLLADGPGFALDTLSAAFFLAPIAVVVWALRALRGPRRSEHLVLAAWGLLTLEFALSQRLNIYYAAPLCGLTVVEASRWAATRLRRVLGRRRPPRLAAEIAAGLLLFATVIPGLRRQLAAAYAPGEDLIHTLEWARVHLPHPFSMYDAGFVPPTRPVPGLSGSPSVLAPWSLGHFVTYYAEEPTAADNFGYGFFDAVRFFLADREDEALAIARARRARWVFVTDLLPKMNDYGDILHRGPYVVFEGGRIERMAAYFHTIEARLYEYDGRGPEPLAHFRLLYQSRTAILRDGRLLARWKIFEIENEPTEPKELQPGRSAGSPR